MSSIKNVSVFVMFIVKISQRSISQKVEVHPSQGAQSMPATQFPPAHMLIKKGERNISKVLLNDLQSNGAA